MAETIPPGQTGSFKLEDAEHQDAERLTAILDHIAARPAVRTLKDWALAQLAPQPGETALDVGAGTGEDVIALRDLVSPPAAETQAESPVGADGARRVTNARLRSA